MDDLRSALADALLEQDADDDCSTYDRLADAVLSVLAERERCLDVLEAAGLEVAESKDHWIPTGDGGYWQTILMVKVKAGAPPAASSTLPLPAARAAPFADSPSDSSGQGSASGNADATQQGERAEEQPMPTWESQPGSQCFTCRCPQCTFVSRDDSYDEHYCDNPSCEDGICSYTMQKAVAVPVEGGCPADNPGDRPTP